MKSDLIIIGAGVIGSAIARELSRFDLDIILVEKEADVACGTSKANSGVIHAGYNASFETTKGQLNVRANPEFDRLCKNLRVPFQRIGSLVVGFNTNDLRELKKKKENGERLGVKGLKIITGEELFTCEPELNQRAKYALYAPTAGIISPYELTIAYADNAALNGVRVLLETEVKGLLIADKKIQGVKTDKGNIRGKIVINAAGLFADKIARMGGESFTIMPRKGEYHLYDKKFGKLVNHILFPMPTETSKGILVTPTVHDNLLVGPNSYWIKDKEELSTTREGLEEIVKGAQKLIPVLPQEGVITSFSGLRATTEGGDFIIDFSREVKGLINVAGIQSPGLSSVPAITEMVIELVKEYVAEENIEIEMKKKANFKETLPEYPRFQEYEDKGELWKKVVVNNKEYGEIICRCEHVTRGEIIAAIHRPVPARTLDAIKRRTRAGMGRCQGGFCGPRLVKILSRELGISPLKVTKRGNKSNIFKARIKELIDESNLANSNREGETDET